MFHVYFEYSKNLVMKNALSIVWTCFWNACVFLTQKYKVDFQNLCIYCQTQKYTWSRLSKLTNLHPNLGVNTWSILFK